MYCMKSPFLIPFIIMMLAVLFPVSAQYASESAQHVLDTDYTCWQCPVCGYMVALTTAEAESIDPYTPCPNCNLAYAGSFIPVSCQPLLGYDQGYNQSHYSSRDYNQPEWKDDESSFQEYDRTDHQKNSDDRTSHAPDSSKETSRNDPAPAQDTASSKGKILMVLPPDQYQEEELNVARDYFLYRGYSVLLASKGVKTARGMSGEKIEVELDLDEIKLPDYVAVVFVGGEGIYSDELHKDPDYQNLARSALKEKKIVAAICLGPWILADAGLLQGKKATASETDHIKSKGAIVSDDAVVKDGMIITANGPSASLEFAETIVAALEKDNPEQGQDF